MFTVTVAQRYDLQLEEAVYDDHAPVHVLKILESLDSARIAKMAQHKKGKESLYSQVKQHYDQKQSDHGRQAKTMSYKIKNKEKRGERGGGEEGGCTKA